MTLDRQVSSGPVPVTDPADPRVADYVGLTDGVRRMRHRPADGFFIAEGDQVAEGDTIVEVSTDKVDAEVPSPAAGTITKLLVEHSPATSPTSVASETSIR